MDSSQPQIMEYCIHYYKKKILCINEPIQFVPTLFKKSQLYIGEYAFYWFMIVQVLGYLKRTARRDGETGIP